MWGMCVTLTIWACMCVCARDKQMRWNTENLYVTLNIIWLYLIHFQLNPKKELMEGVEGYNSDPTLEDKVHVLVCDVPVDSGSRLSDETVKKMREVRMAASELGECTTIVSLRGLIVSHWNVWVKIPGNKCLKPVLRLKRTQATSIRASTWRKRYILQLMHNVIFQLCHVCSSL